jgi:hypothetical protein
LYIDVLPRFARQGNPDIAGESALVAFADRPWPLAALGGGSAQGASSNAFISIVALQPGQPISTTSLSPKVAPDPPDLTWWWVQEGAASGILFNAPTTISSRPCTPSFTRPCVIDVESTVIPDFTISHTPSSRMFE